MDVQGTTLGALIRAWRDRVDPAAVGLPVRHDRRAVGLRREELAEFAGVSVDYVVRLEQGRALSPSAQIVGALARALQLTRPERDLLYEAAGLRPPADGLITDHIPPGMQRVLRRLGDAPAGVFAADWRLLWWNPGWVALLGDPSGLPPAERNVVLTRFPADGARDAEQPSLTLWPVVSDHADDTDRAFVADLRRALARFPQDPRLGELIRRLTTSSSRFAALWSEGAVGVHREDRKIIKHPHVGDITIDCDVLVDAETELKLVVYTAVPGSEDAAKLDFAHVIGFSAPA